MAEERPRGGETGTDGGSAPTRKERRREAAAARRRARRTWEYLIGGVAAVVLAVGVAAALTAHHQNTARAADTTTTTHPAAPPAACPLTGTPAPGGVVPARPALAFKIGNYSGDRPSAGLNQADIVFEEPVEGAITRLVAVFQCQSAPLVGDLRSARQPDVGILSQLSHPIFVHAGGIAPVLSLLANAPLDDRNILAGSGSGIINPSSRYAPYATFSNTAMSWALAPSDTAPPAPIFSYGTALPPGAIPSSGGSVHIPFGSSSDVTWQWNAATGTYLREYSGQPDILVGGAQTSATNVVVMSVTTSTGSWVENEEGGREVVVTSTGTGPLLVLRNGAAVMGTWSRAAPTQPATLTSSSGSPIDLAPGNTWVELVPQHTPIQLAPVAGSTGSTGTTAPSSTSPTTTAR
jgi:hypothetical protein